MGMAHGTPHPTTSACNPSPHPHTHTPLCAPTQVNVRAFSDSAGKLAIDQNQFEAACAGGARSKA
eukprot:2854038-Prymnesium_polylepis.1